MYAGTDRGVIVTTDGWRTWSEVATGASRRYVLSLAVHPRGHVVYAGTEGNSVFAVDLP
jgi:hypothetical protein